ncbi:WD40 repeat domain-containing protein, partial [Actinomadura adrarensis]
MRVVWTTSTGADPRLTRVLPGPRADAVAQALVGGVPVFVTATDPHYDGDCARPNTHDCGAQMVQVWDAATGELLRTVPDVGGEHLVAATVDGRTLAVVCDWSATPKLVDLESGVVLRTVGVHQDIVQGLAIAELPDGPVVVSVGFDQNICISSLSAAETLVVPAGERLDGLSVIDLDGRAVALIAGRESVGLWDLELGGVRIGSIPVPRVRRIASWPGADPLVALLPWEGDVQLWDVSAGERRPCGVSRARLSDGIAGVVADDGRRLLALGCPEDVRLWNVEADRAAGPPLVGPTSWCALAVGGPGTLITLSGADEAIGIWRAGDDPGRPDTPDTGPMSTVRCLTVSPDERILAGCTDGSVGTWRLEDGARDRTVGVLPARVNAVAAVPLGDGVGVIAGAGDIHETRDDALHRWLDDGPDEPVTVDHRGEIRIIAAAVLDGRPIALTAGCDTTPAITDLVTGERLGEKPGDRMPDGIAVGELGGRPVAAVSRFIGPF